MILQIINLIISLLAIVLIIALQRKNKKIIEKLIENLQTQQKSLTNLNNKITEESSQRLMLKREVQKLLKNNQQLTTKVKLMYPKTK